MKSIAFAAILSIAGCFTRLAAQNDFDRNEPHPIFHSDQLSAVADTPEPWSVIGQWHYARPDWRGMIEIRADGTFSRAGDGQSGKWKLTVAGDHFILTLKWNHFPQDTIAFINPTLFQSENSKGGVIVRRLPG